MIQSETQPPASSSRRSNNAGVTIAQTRGRRALIAVFAAFFIPLLLAIVLYANLDIWKPATHVNHGELLLPIQPLAVLEAKAEDGSLLSPEALMGHWTLIYLAQGDCRLECQAALFKIRQARAMLGRDLVRVKAIYLTLEPPAVATRELLRAEHANMTLAEVLEARRESQADAFGVGVVANQIYLIDPHGNRVLRYDDAATTKGILKDIKRLLKVSQIG